MLEQEQAELRMVAEDVIRMSCREGFLLQPFIADMPASEYR